MKGFIKIIICTTWCLLISNEIIGQLYRPYDLGDLVLEDFEGDILDVDFGGQLYFEYWNRDSLVILDDRKVKINYFEVGIDTWNSWLDVNGDFEIALAYFQLLFDVEYLFAKKINALAFADPFDYSRADLQELQNEKSILLDKIKLESINGQRLDIIEKWSNRVDEDINDVEVKLVNLELDVNLGMGLHIGVGRVSHSDEIKENFGNNVGFAFGLDFVFKKYLLTMSGMIGFGGMPSDLPTFPFWDEGITRSNALFNIAVGRSFDFKHVKLTPFVGSGVNNLFVNKEEYDGVYQSVSESAWTFGGGVFLDVPLKINIGGTSAYGQYRADVFFEHGLRFAFHWVGKNTIYQYSGNSMGMSLNYYYVFGRLSQKKVQSK